MVPKLSVLLRGIGLGWTPSACRGLTLGRNVCYNRSFTNRNRTPSDSFRLLPTRCRLAIGAALYDKNGGFLEGLRFCQNPSDSLRTRIFAFSTLFVYEMQTLPTRPVWTFIIFKRRDRRAEAHWVSHRPQADIVPGSPIANGQPGYDQPGYDHALAFPLGFLTTGGRLWAL